MILISFSIEEQGCIVDNIDCRKCYHISVPVNQLCPTSSSTAAQQDPTVDTIFHEIY